MEDLRRAFDLHPEAIYLDAAGEGPLPRCARDALLSVLDRKINPFRLGGEEYFQIPGRVREQSARIAGCRPEEIVLTSSTGAGINLAAAGLPLKAGDEVLLLKGDFPALVNPFLQARSRGIVPVDITPSGKFPSPLDFQRAITPRTRVIAVSHVLAHNGFRNDLAALGGICRERGIWFVVDAAQSAGVLPLNLEETSIDLLAAPAHKWLLGPPGAGFAAIRADVMERMTAPAVGWMGAMSHAAQLIAPPPFDLSRFIGGRKFEVGTPSYLQLAAWSASLEMINEIGVERIEKHVTTILEPLREYLGNSPYKVISSPDVSHRSGILSFTGKFPAKLLRLLHEQKIFAGLRAGALRFSPHFYNKAEEIGRVIEALRELESVKLDADRKGENL